MIERIPTPQAAKDNERISNAEKSLNLPVLHDAVSDVLVEFPRLHGMPREAAEDVFQSKVQAVYETIRDHIDAIEEKLDDSAELLSESEFRNTLEEMFGRISKVISEYGERMNALDINTATLPEIDTLQAMYRNLLERHNQS